MADGRHIEKKIVFFGYISAPYWPINAKFGTEMTNHHADIGHVTKNGNIPKILMTITTL